MRDESAIRILMRQQEVFDGWLLPGGERRKEEMKTDDTGDEHDETMI